MLLIPCVHFGIGLTRHERCLENLLPYACVGKRTRTTVVTKLAGWSGGSFCGAVLFRSPTNAAIINSSPTRPMEMVSSVRPDFAWPTIMCAPLHPGISCRVSASLACRVALTSPLSIFGFDITVASSHAMTTRECFPGIDNDIANHPRGMIEDDIVDLS